MGEEAPECVADNTDKFPVLGFDSDAQAFQTSTTINDKIYVVGGSDESEINVKILDKLTGKWSIPTVLGSKPGWSKSHSAILLQNKRILIIKRDTKINDCTWFLEVDTPFVREQKKLLGTDVVAWSKGVKGDGPKPIVISGPSGVGKGTLISKLMKEFPSTFGFSVSHTTRAPRENEVNGVHYHFSERSQMEKEISEGKFLESALVHGNLYGTSIDAVDAVTDVGKRCILDIDVQGARSVRASSLEAKFIFVSPPSFDELENRLRSRGTETEEQVQKRLRNARSELEQGKSSGLFDHILVNDDLEMCYQNLKKLLGLEETHDISYQTTEDNFKTPMNYSLSQNDEKIVLHCDNMQANSSNKLIIDVSSLKGGAPGRTRGVNMYTVGS